MRNYIQTTSTAAGKRASYGMINGSPWVSFDHGQHRHTAIYTTSGWRTGMARIRGLIVRHGIKIKPADQTVFGTPENVS